MVTPMAHDSVHSTIPLPDAVAGSVPGADWRDRVQPPLVSDAAFVEREGRGLAFAHLAALSAVLVFLLLDLALLDQDAFHESPALVFVVGVLAVLLSMTVGELLQRMADLRAARARIVEAAMAERRRVERDLHDGAQQQFLAVMATLAQSDFATEAQMRDLVSDARLRLGEALAELRRLARGLPPAALSQGGLSAALPYVCRSSSERVTLSLDPVLLGHRLEPGVESAAYFVVAEALANVTRYAQARSVTVTVVAAGPYLSLEVADDGNGKAHFTQEGGLTRLRDRVHALGGEVVLHSDPCARHPQYRGSRLRVGLPATVDASS